ncbi:sensor histidine kinase [Bacillus sp. Marseille-Q1617]|uniref:sensor histidine kinase n=1 Tax=Bacillus sp. Marseille-Q1617 TaxID=2736887 RepID=UPI00158DD29D|nr:sensor histidine kinase [Bacillus sp. Marseille-Q1617]
MRSVRSRLFGMLILFIILPYFLSVFIIYSNTKTSVEEHEIETSREELQESGAVLERYFEDMISLPYALYNDPDVLRVFEQGLQGDQENSFERSMKIFSVTRPDIRQLRFYFNRDKEAMTVYRSKFSAPKVQEDILLDPLFKKLSESEQNYLIEAPHVIENTGNAAIIPESDKTKVLTIHHKVKNILTGKFLGFLSMDIELNSYGSIIQHLSDTGDARVALLDDNGTIIYSSRKGETFKGEASPDELILKEELEGELEGWKLVKIIPKDALFKDVNEAAYSNILLGIGVVVLGIIMVIVISHIITKPIIHLSEKVRSIEGGNLDIDFTTSRKDELGHLEEHMDDMMHRINQHIDREYKLEIESRKNQFRALKSQVNPHFLFNALQTIGAVALRSNAKDVYRLITSLSKMMRYSLYADQWVTVKDELNYIESYLSLQKERFGEGVRADIIVEEDVLPASIPSMVLQPLVENYFKHSYEEGYENSSLAIHGKREGNSITFIVQNTGVHMTEEELKRVQSSLHKKGRANSGIGLKNIYERLQLNFNDETSFDIDRMDGKGFRVTMTLPFLEDR